MNAGLWIMIGVIILFILLGVYLSMGKGSMLIAGYNTMPEEERAKYDTKALCKAMGKLMFGLSFSMILWTVGLAIEQMSVFYIGLALFFFIIFGGLIYMNAGNRYKKSDSF